MERVIRKVFIAQRPLPDKTTGWVPDLSHLETFGEIVDVFVSGFDTGRNIAPAMLMAEEKFRDFDYGLDYFCATSLTSPIALMLCVSELWKLDVPYVKVLNWNRGKSKYVEIEIPFN